MWTLSVIWKTAEVNPWAFHKRREGTFAKFECWSRNGSGHSWNFGGFLEVKWREGLNRMDVTKITILQTVNNLPTKMKEENHDSSNILYLLRFILMTVSSNCMWAVISVDHSPDITLHSLDQNRPGKTSLPSLKLASWFCEYKYPLLPSSIPFLSFLPSPRAGEHPTTERVQWFERFERVQRFTIETI